MQALGRLARGNYEVWKLGRHNRTGMYIDHVNPLVPHAQQQWIEASADAAGPGLAMECVAAALGFISIEEAAERVLLTLRSFAGLTPGFNDPRNQLGWLPTFMNVDTGACFTAPTLGCLYSTDSTAFNTVGVLFAKTFFERAAPNAPTTAEIAQLAERHFSRVQWQELFCSKLVGANSVAAVSKEGPFVPWLYNATTGCRDSFGPAADGLYDYNEMHWLVWLAHESVCGAGRPQPCKPTDPIEKLWRGWEGRADAPNYHYAGQDLLTLWPSYVVQLPYYLVHAFNADKRFTDLFAEQWRAEWAFYNSSLLNAGENGRYGSGAGPTAAWCAGVAYKADLISTAPDAQTCRTYSPYAVAGYLPVAPDVIKGHLLDLLATGEAVLPVSGTDTFVLWRKSLIEPGWSPVPKAGAKDAGYGITLVDFAAELFGLSTLWLGADFYVNNTNHFGP